MTDVCAAQQRGGASAPITFNVLPAQGRSRSAPVLIIWTRVDRRPSRLHEVLQHPFDKAPGPAERRESSTATSAGPAHTYSGSRGPLVVTASAIPACSTHVMVRARGAAKPASRGPATAGVNGWERPLCRRFLSPTSSPVNLRHARTSWARRGRSCALNLATLTRLTTTSPTSLLRPNSSRKARPARQADSPDGAVVRAGLDTTWWCAAFVAIPPTCTSSHGWSPASRQTCWRPKPASNRRPPSRTPRTPATAMRHDAARSRALTECGGSTSLAATRKEGSTRCHLPIATPTVVACPRTRRLNASCASPFTSDGPLSAKATSYSPTSTPSLIGESLFAVATTDQVPR